MTGQNLIRAAELRAVTTEFSAYQTAVLTFRDKYMALPGDMTNATKFWGAMTNCGVASPSGTGTQTCNGDGDGQIEMASAASRTGEMFSIWKQLANAGLIEGNYSSIASSSSAFHTSIGVNVPSSRISNSGWTSQWLGTISSAHAHWFEGQYNNALWIGKQVAGGDTADTTFSAEEAWNIDSKIDDGKPEVGKLRSRKNHAGTGTTHCSNTTTREYSLTNAGVLCILVFLQAF